MLPMTFSDLASLTAGSVLQQAHGSDIHFLITDTRKAFASAEALFIALPGPRQHGHAFIADAYRAGIRQFVVEAAIEVGAYADANFFLAESSLRTLQDLALHAREHARTQDVIAITGSNGKTIVKELLSQFLADGPNPVVKNPGSYNSQMGVALSVWALHGRTDSPTCIFEAGISQPGEMARLEHMIAPTQGIFTNIGSAHDEGFASREEKVREKLLLFARCHTVVYCADHPLIDALMRETYPNKNRVSWGRATHAVWQLAEQGDQITLSTTTETCTFTLTARDSATRENILHSVVMLLSRGTPPARILLLLDQIKQVPMRLQRIEGIHHCRVVDDTYNIDLEGLRVSLEFLSGELRPKKTVILSDVFQTGLTPESTVAKVVEILKRHALHRVLAIGPMMVAHRTLLQALSFAVHVFPSVEDFLRDFVPDDFRDEAILVKGARAFRLERIVQRLQRKHYNAVMEIDIKAMVDNLNFFRNRLQRGVKTMVMVKAFAYGSGSEEVAGMLAYHRVDYLGVAYPSEGAELRSHFIQLPIMVMNPSLHHVPLLLAHGLEPSVYSLSFLEGLVLTLAGEQEIKIHLELETGMNRLGLAESEWSRAIDILRAHPNVQVASVFSHLAGADEPQHDDYSREQAAVFLRGYEKITSALNIRPLRHLLNSAGILRLPEFQFDMVRLGIGLYGVSPTAEPVPGLTPVATLKTTISQIKKVSSGTTVGYGRKGKAAGDRTLATIAIGYADGFSRAFSNGKGKVLVNGHLAPVIGNVCMDMTMIDITGIDAREGDEVIIFGSGRPIHEVARAIGTIPYELLTSTSERVKREFFTESL